MNRLKTKTAEILPALTAGAVLALGATACTAESPSPKHFTDEGCATSTVGDASTGWGQGAAERVVEAAVIRAAAGTPGISPSEAKQLPTYTAAHEVAERANKLTPNLDPEDTMKGCVRVELDDQGKPAKVVVTKVSTTDTPNNG